MKLEWEKHTSPRLMFFQNIFSNDCQFFISLCQWEQWFFICLPFWVENSSLSDSYLLHFQFIQKWDSFSKRYSLVRLLFKYNIGLIKTVLWRMYVKAAGISIAWSQLYQKIENLNVQAHNWKKIKRSLPSINVILGSGSARIHYCCLLDIFSVFWGKKSCSLSLPLHHCLTFEKFLCLLLCNSQEHIAWKAYMADNFSMYHSPVR